MRQEVKQFKLKRFYFRWKQRCVTFLYNKRNEESKMNSSNTIKSTKKNQLAENDLSYYGTRNASKLKKHNKTKKDKITFESEHTRLSKQPNNFKENLKYAESKIRANVLYDKKIHKTLKERQRYQNNQDDLTYEEYLGEDTEENKPGQRRIPKIDYMITYDKNLKPEVIRQKSKEKANYETSPLPVKRNKTATKEVEQTEIQLPSSEMEKDDDEYSQYKSEDMNYGYKTYNAKNENYPRHTQETANFSHENFRNVEVEENNHELSFKKTKNVQDDERHSYSSYSPNEGKQNN